MSQAQTLKNFLAVQKRGTTNVKESGNKKRALAILDAALSETPPVKKTRTSARLKKLEPQETPTEPAEGKSSEPSAVVTGPTQNIIDRILTRSRRKLVQPKLEGFLNPPKQSAEKGVKDAEALIKSNFSFEKVDDQATGLPEKDIQSSTKQPLDLKPSEPKVDEESASSNTEAEPSPVASEPTKAISKTPGYIKYRHLLKPSQNESSKPQVPEAPKETTFSSVKPVSQNTVPGFKKHSHLLAGKIDLPLPEKFETLEKIFHALHHTIVFFKSQNLNCVYHRMKKPVENMCNRTFSLDHLAQIKTVYPEAFKYEAVKYMHQGQRIESVLLEVNDDAGKLYDDQSNIYETLKLAGSKLEERLKEFRRRLVNIVKAEHQKFLASLAVSVDTKNRTLIKWHPQFDLSSVPDIPKSELPKIDKPVIGIAKSRMLEKLVKPSAESESTKETSDATNPSPHTNAIAKASSLLERIRAKEKKRNEDIMFGLSPEILRRKTMLSRLPILADSINFIFTSSKKTVLRQGEVVRKIIESSKTPLSEAEVVNHLKLGAELAPSWIKLMSIGNNVMVKLDRGTPMKDVKEVFNSELQKISS